MRPGRVLLRPSRYDHSMVSTVLRILGARALGRNLPLMVLFFVTYRCSRRCAYCAVWRRPTVEMPTGTILDLVDQMAAMGVQRLSLLGGEPMVRDDIGDIVSRAKRRGLTVNLLSNGHRIAERIDTLAGLDFLSLSIDGPAELHDAQRGRGSFAESVAALEAARSRGIPVWATMVLTRHNVEAVPEVIALARGAGFQVTFQPVMSQALDAQNALELAPTRPALEAAIDHILREKQQGAPIPMSSDVFRFMKRHWRPEATSGSSRPGPWHADTLRCRAARLFFSVAPNGDCHPCDLLHDLPDPPNAVVEGLASAVARLRPPDCGGCWCDSTIEANQIFSLRPGPILNMLRLLW